MEVDQRKVKKLFERYDTNHNEILEKREFLKGFKEMLSEIGENLPIKKHEEVAQEGIKKFDLNGNGVLEYDEFEHLVEFLIYEKGYNLK